MKMMAAAQWGEEKKGGPQKGVRKCRDLIASGNYVIICNDKIDQAKTHLNLQH